VRISQPSTTRSKFLSNEHFTFRPPSPETPHANADFRQDMDLRPRTVYLNRQFHSPRRSPTSPVYRPWSRYSRLSVYVMSLSSPSLLVFSSYIYPSNLSFLLPKPSPDFMSLGTVPRCTRIGDKGFTRRDHLVEHLRNFHHLDIPKRRPGERSAGLPPY
jgi:hypothetical protein